MLLQRKTVLGVLLVGLFLLSACGFRPMYGEGNAGLSSQGSALQGNVRILPVGSDNRRFAQVLRNALEDRFNPQGVIIEQPDYTLQVDLRRQVVPAVVRSDGTILRYDVHFDADYTMTRNGLPKNSKEKPLIGTIRRISSYNVVPNANFATYEAEESLNERILKEIAEDFVLRISGYIAGK